MTWRRRLERRFGITARQVAVRTHVPWYMRWSLLLLAAAAVAAIAWATFDLGRNMSGYHSAQAAAEQARLAEAVTRLQDENQDLRDQLAAAERQMQIGQSTHDGLAGQLQALSDENALLKEDLAFFQTLMTSGGGDAGSGITINRFRVRADTMPGEYRYQLLVVQARTRGKEFQGRLQLVVDLLKDGEQQVLTLPTPGEQRGEFDLSFKFYKRVDGAFRVPESAKVTRVQVRVLENGVEQPRSSQTVVLS
jgi:hypothetical protein